MFFVEAILDQNLDELYVMWQRRPPHVQISVSWSTDFSLILIEGDGVNP